MVQIDCIKDSIKGHSLLKEVEPGQSLHRFVHNLQKISKQESLSQCPIEEIRGTANKKLEYYKKTIGGFIWRFFSALRNFFCFGTFKNSAQIALELCAKSEKILPQSQKPLPAKEKVNLEQVPGEKFTEVLTGFFGKEEAIGKEAADALSPLFFDIDTYTCEKNSYTVDFGNAKAGTLSHPNNKKLILKLNKEQRIDFSLEKPNDCFNTYRRKLVFTKGVGYSLFFSGALKEIEVIQEEKAESTIILRVGVLFGYVKDISLSLGEASQYLNQIQWKDAP